MTMWFEDITLGEKVVVGSYTFTEDEIIDFGRKYDPQPFHVDREAASRSPYGGIIASGWQVGAVYMKLTVAFFDRMRAAGDVEGIQPNYVSPGFRNMRWLKPVRPGMTLTYSLQRIGKLDWPSRPTIGLLETKNEAHDETGELVFDFVSRVLVPKRPK
jgi:acyl dehydratase